MPEPTTCGQGLAQHAELPVLMGGEVTLWGCR